MSLADLILQRIQNQLAHTTADTPSKWATRYRVLKDGPWNFRNHPWLRAMHDSTAPFNWGQKAAQLGYSETALNIAIYYNDVKNQDVLYVLPVKVPDAANFSASRFNPALELSPHLSRLYTDVQNIGHKRAGSANLYVRGSRSRSGLKSVPVSVVILDELNEMDPDNVTLVFERTSGQKTSLIWGISTPTVAGVGINKYYQTSTQEHFFFPCPSCSRQIELTFPESLDGNQLICTLCRAILHHEDKPNFLAHGKWVPSFPGRDERGFHISQLYSSTVTPKQFQTSYERSLLNPADEQEFYNSKLGLPHAVEGASITDADLDACMGNFQRQSSSTVATVMGVDVGAKLHYTIRTYVITADGSHATLLQHGTVQEFEELDPLVNQFKVISGVMDANPERRKALEFARRHPQFKLCFYGRGVQGRSIKEHTHEPTITVDRTSWIDAATSRIRQHSISLPSNIDNEYRSHLKNVVRLYVRDGDGNPVARYECPQGQDHYAHAETYAELAFHLSTNFRRSFNI